MFHAVNALAAAPAGLSGADDRGRGAGPDVTANARRPGAGRPLLRHAGGGNGRVAQYACSPIAATWRRRPRDRVRSKRPEPQNLARSAKRWAALASVDRRAALGGAAALFRLPARRGHPRRRSVAGAAPPEAAAAASQDPRYRTKSRRCSPRSRNGRRAASRWRFATWRCLNCFMGRAFARPSWFRCHGARSGRASRS